MYRLAALFSPPARGFLGPAGPQSEKLTNVVVDFAGSKVWDSSALVAIDDLASKYRDAGKTLRLRHLSRDCAALLERAGDLVEVDAETDPVYAVAADYGANALVAASEAAPRGGARMASTVSRRGRRTRSGDSTANGEREEKEAFRAVRA